MSKKGFTLIELLGTLVVIALISILVVPRIVDWYSNSTDNYKELNEELIIEAARTYVEENPNIYLKTDGSVYYITMQQLINYGSLEENNVKKVGKDDYEDSQVKVIYNGTYFEYYLEK
ncbi:MAG: type II secretion system protein [Bacilli bacterium]|nr:type II secretion system protein [Bacilli bacterium]